jgi:hypothetical protein
MKSLILGSLSVLLLSASITPAIATGGRVLSTPMANATTVKTHLNASETVQLAYQGYLADEGVPGYLGLLSGYQSRRITAHHVVEAAVKSKRLPKGVEADQSFINAVNIELRSLERIIRS